MKILVTAKVIFIIVLLQCVSNGMLQSAHLATPSGVPVKDEPLSGRTKDAYVTLQYGGFLLGARVLGKSLRDTGTEKDMIALCTETVSEEAKEVLKADGWQIRPAKNIENPYAKKSSRGSYFSGAYSKLHMWNMTEYDRIVYLDSDVLVLSNIDHLFDCGTFCAVYRHSDLFNSGVFVLEPSSVVFNNMLKMVSVLPSYTEGDQGFLNMYFQDLKYASMFNWSNPTRQQQPMRLAAGFNGDIGMYYLDNKWVIPPENLRILHYTMGPVKPWKWWANYLFDLNQLWIDVRMRLPDHGYESCRISFHFWAPYPLLIFLFILGLYIKSIPQSPDVTWMLGVFTVVSDIFSHYFPIPVLLLSYVLTYQYIVPTTMIPSQAEYVFWLWSNFFLLVFFGLYCCTCHAAAKQGGASIPRKIRLSVMVYLVFVSSCVLLKVVPPTVAPFSKRLIATLVFLSIHVVVSHKCGQYLIQTWTGSTRASNSPVHQLPDHSKVDSYC